MSTDPDSEGPEDRGTVPIRILEHTILKFTDTALPHDLTRLRQHKENILLYHQRRNWERLNSEQVNASRTVQQLKRNFRALEDIRCQVREEDLQKFDTRLAGVKKEVVAAIEAYGTVQRSVGPPASHDLENMEFEEMSVSEQSVLIPRQEAAVESWEELQTNLVELSEVMNVLANEVKVQGRAVDGIAENIDVATSSVHAGQQELRKASRYKLYLLPVGGAIVGGIVGGVVGGPLGALAGLKVGAITLAAGGTAGAVGGAYMGYWRKKARDREEEEEERTESKKER